jgi:hypothetical protein
VLELAVALKREAPARTAVQIRERIHAREGSSPSAARSGVTSCA